MTSRLLSQIFDRNSASIYETFREQDAAMGSDSDLDDVEERAGMQHPIAGRAHVDEEESEMGDESTFQLRQRPAVPERQLRFFPALSGPSRGYRFTQARYQTEEDNTDVPQSLLFESGGSSSRPRRQAFSDEDSVLEPSASITGDPGPSTMKNRRLEEQWNAATAPVDYDQSPTNKPRPPAPWSVSAKERALWKWANVENLDIFLQDVYVYYLGKGIYNIMLTRLLNLLTLMFVVGFTTFLTFCVDYNAIHTHEKLSEITKRHCMSEMSATATLIQWMISFFCVYKFASYIMDIRRLIDIYNFYTHLLGIPDSDMQTISWQEVVARLMVLRDANPYTSQAQSTKNKGWTNASKQRMDAHDICNRLMRRENYLIALFNKDILDLTVPLPFFRNRGPMLTRTLEWNLSQCILDFAFTDQGQFRPLFLNASYRKALSDGLRRRFLFAAVMNAIFAPFIATYFLVLFLLRNLHDFIKTPSRIGHRQYTPLAEWKFREFNELWHLFQMRINMSYPAAEVYVDQFPKEKTAQVARFVSFVASALLGVLVVGSMVDSELLKNFKIVGEVNAVTCIGILTTIVAFSRGMLQDDYAVYDPEWSITNVIQHTHYMPDSWKDKLHSDDVKREFMQLYTMKLTIFIEELLSVFFTPFILYFSLPKCSERIIDFFREFTVHVDGVGYVCSFGMFDFKKPGQQNAGDLREEYFATKDNKMLASYLGFMDQYHPSPNRGGGGGKRPQPTHPHPFIVSNPVGSTCFPQNRRGAPNLAQSMLGRGGIQGSVMMRSSLLDHHHQPLRTNIREEDEEDEGGLGDSFVSQGVEENSSLKRSEGVDKPISGAGVLGLLNQFVTAHDGGSRPAGAVV